MIGSSLVGAMASSAMERARCTAHSSFYAYFPAAHRANPLERQRRDQAPNQDGRHLPNEAAITRLVASSSRSEPVGLGLVEQGRQLRHLGADLVGDKGATTGSRPWRRPGHTLTEYAVHCADRRLPEAMSVKVGAISGVQANSRLPLARPSPARKSLTQPPASVTSRSPAKASQALMCSSR